MFKYRETKNPIFKYVALGIGVAVLLGIAWLFGNLALNLSSGGSGDYDIISTTPSPDGKYVAIVYSGSGGGAAGWTFLRATVNPADEPFNPEKSANFVFDIKGSEEIETKWEGNSNLLIIYTYKPENTNTYFKVSKETLSTNTGVKIRYIENIE